MGAIVMTDQASTDLREEVRARYAEAAQAVLNPRPGVSASCAGTVDSGSCGGTPDSASCCGTGSAALDTADAFGGPLYAAGETDGLPEDAVLASLGCGNPLAVADLREGERVLDLGSGGGRWWAGSGPGVRSVRRRRLRRLHEPPPSTPGAAGSGQLAP